MNDALLSNATSADAVTLLSDAAAKSVLLLGAAALACVWLRNASAAVRHQVWTAALAASLAVPALTLALPGWSVLPSWTAVYDSPADGAGALGNLSVPARQGDLLAGTHATTGSAHLLPTADWDSSAGFGGDRIVSTGVRLTLQLWAAGAVLCLLPMLFGSWISLRIVRTYPVVDEGVLSRELATVAGEAGVRAPRLHLGPVGTMPMVWGLGRGRMLLPADATQWDSERLRAVLLHELAHLQRRDPLSMLVGQLARAVYWFNPLAWLAVSRMRVERERACDDRVLCSGARPSDYAASILELATGRRFAGLEHAALAIAAPPRIEARLRSILDPARDRRGVSRRTAVCTLAVALLAVSVLSIARAEDKPAFQGSLTGELVVAGESPEERQQPAAESNSTLDLKLDELTFVPDDSKGKQPNFLVFPIRTELQRYLVNHGPGTRSEHAKAYVMVDGMSVIGADGKVDASAIGLKRLRTELEPYADREAGIVYFQVFYGDVSTAEGSKELLGWALEGFGRSVGFKQARVTSTYGREWERLLETIKNNTSGTGAASSDGAAGFGSVSMADEPMSGDGTVQVYPVRTRLCRLLTGSDCVIDLLPPIDEASDVPLSRETEESMKKLVSELKLDRRQKVLIRVRTTSDEGRNALERFVEDARMRLQQELGFESSAVSHTPQ